MNQNKHAGGPDYDDRQVSQKGGDEGQEGSDKDQSKQNQGQDSE